MGVGSDTRIFEGGKVVDTNVCTASSHREKISAMDSTAITSEDLRELRTEANGSLCRAGMSTMEMSRDDATSQSTKRCVSVDDTCSLESVHVRGVYDQIAPHIQDLKQRTWPRVKDFLDSLAPGSFVADIGCGNGRYLQANPSVVSLGLDTCQSFVEAASAKGSEVMSADNLSLPFRDEIFDAVLSVGVIHHFASLERRVRAVEELVRILSKGGRMMIYVWAFEQKYRRMLIAGSSGHHWTLATTVQGQGEGSSVSDDDSS
ncbi:hypothetical protein BaRGS_00012201 [Batillaria attramentaria]|uniref:Methyltransferase type 11 domain-containing protein n=1 Tax=Batillaria attramentaria TaxID=370345 RepID=A0ABD0LAX5_9CAEN